MVGLLLVGLSTLAEEIRDSFGKYEIQNHKLNIYALGFLTALGGLITILLIGLFVPKDFFAPGIPAGFVFSAASLPTLLVRLLLELLQTYITLRAIVETDRSTFGFLRTLTLPLLFVVDVMLGYHFGVLQVVGFGTIVLGLLILFINHGFDTRGSGMTFIGALNAVFTISLFKYNVTYFNSVEMEQLTTFSFMALVLFCIMLFKRQKPLHLLWRPASLLNIVLSGFGNIVFGFALTVAPASVIMAAKRSLSVFWTILSGHRLFAERHIVLKLIVFALVSLGIILLIFNLSLTPQAITITTP